MNRISIIQSLIDKNNYKNYLEVGVQAGHCFQTIQCENKTGVDPDLESAATHKITSDQFFKENELSFDIIFLDGLHHADQLEKDILNALKALKEGGTIVCHDMLPTSKRMQEIPLQEQNEWTGNVWETWVKLRITRSDLQMHCINTDWATSIIKKGKQELLVNNLPINYENFIANKNEWMNIITIEQFKNIYL